MKLSRAVLIGVLALGLTGAVTAAAADAGEPAPTGSAPPVTTTTTAPALPAVPACPPPGAKVDTFKVENGKIYHNGEEVGTLPAEGPSVIAMKDGKLYFGEDAKALPTPPGAEFHTSVKGEKSVKDGKSAEGETSVNVETYAEGEPSATSKTPAEGGASTGGGPSRISGTAEKGENLSCFGE
ncbi:hypothetical protein [Sphaerisporangium corydalis]|uniref:Uncharacterized protein n=1 Tax=Sphaerisporangium corydalis TaxID=1441875 RepID=A0ABV9EH90_9ACTN|nr:hypothetical protein [Sphaerisporangium corydalis]